MLLPASARQLVLYGIIAVALALGGAWELYRSGSQAVKEQFQQRSADILHENVSRLELLLQLPVGDLRSVLANPQLFSRGLRSKEALHDYLRIMLSTVLSGNDEYAEARWVDLSGQPQLRLTRTASEQVELVAPEAGDSWPVSGELIQAMQKIEAFQLSKSRPRVLTADDGQRRSVIEIGAKLPTAPWGTPGFVVIRLNLTDTFQQAIISDDGRNFFVVNSAGEVMAGNPNASLSSYQPPSFDLSSIDGLTPGELPNRVFSLSEDTLALDINITDQSDPIYGIVNGGSQLLQDARSDLAARSLKALSIALLITAFFMVALYSALRSRASRETEVERLQQSVDYRDEYYRWIFSKMDQIIFIFDQRGHVIYGNPLFRNTLSTDSEKLNIFDLHYLEPSIIHKVTDDISSIFQKEIKGRIYRFSVCAVRRPEGRTQTEFLATATDISDLARAHSQLFKMNEELSERTYQAESVATVKGNFLSNMSHEIRTPMTAVQGLLHLLQNTALDADQRSIVTKITRSSKALLSVINDVLDISKLESGKLEAVPISFQLELMVRDLVDLFEASFVNKGVQLNLRYDSTIPGFILGDEQRIRQVITNLLGNALKFTQQGSVTLEARVVTRNSEDEGRILEIAVSDTGIGIPEDKQSDIFSSFTQSDSSISRIYGGTGLGLSISRSLAELMGGDLTLQSEPGKGSRFELMLPLITPADAPALQTKISIIVGMGGDRLSRLQSGLRSWDYTTMYEDDLENLEPPLRYSQEDDTDFVLFVSVPSWTDRSLETFIRKLLKFGYCSSRLKVIFDVANSAELGAGHQNVHEERKICGVCCVIWSGPFSASAVHDLADLTDIGQTELSNEDLASEDEVCPPGACSVLLVDDNEVNLEIIVAFLKPLNLDLCTASDGVDAVKAARETKFDLIIMDLHMPRMSGFEAIETIRAGGPNWEAPIIALSAAVLQSDVEHAMRSGASAHLAKPIDPQKLLRTVRQHLRRAANGRVAKNNSAQSLTEPQPPGTGGAESILARHLSVYPVLETKFSGNTDMIIRVLRMFVSSKSDTPNRLRSPDETLEAKRQLLHWIRGAVGNLGYKDFEQLALGQEQLLANGDSSADMTAVADQLEEIYGELKYCLKELDILEEIAAQI